MDDELETLKRNFPKLNVKGRITFNTFSNAGYSYVEWASEDLRKLIHALTWCNNHTPDSFHFTDKTFWFTNKEDATEFALIWL